MSKQLNPKHSNPPTDNGQLMKDGSDLPFYHPLRPVRGRRGVALILALFSVMIMTFLAFEIQYDSAVEYTVSSHQVNRLKAYYAAKAALEISLLRILIFKQAVAQFGEQLGGAVTMLDPIWQFPFAWPPVLPEETSRVDKELVKDIVETSYMQSQYVATIQSEGGKIDINDLGSESQALRESTKAQILQIFQTKFDNDDDFRNAHGDVRFEEVVNNLIDWVDENQESLNGGDEKSQYRDRDMQSEFIPPNQPFKTLEELHMVAGMRDDFYDLLKDKVTVYGIKGINVNYADKQVLKALDPQMDDEIVSEVLARRSNPEEGGPFKNEEEFISYLGSQGIRTADFNQAGIPLVFEPEFNFRVTAVGQSGNVTRTITAITYDFENLVGRIVSILDREAEKDQDPNNAPDPNKQEPPNENEPAQNQDRQKQIKIPKGRPTIVYWNET